MRVVIAAEGTRGDIHPMLAFGEALVVGGLLAAGSVARRRPLELGSGLLARAERGGLALGASLTGAFLFVSSLFREGA